MNFDGPKIPKGIAEYFLGPPLFVAPIKSLKFKKMKLKSVASFWKFFIFSKDMPVLHCISPSHAPVKGHLRLRDSRTLADKGEPEIVNIKKGKSTTQKARTFTFGFFCNFNVVFLCGPVHIKKSIMSKYRFFAIQPGKKLNRNGSNKCSDRSANTKISGECQIDKSQTAKTEFGLERDRTFVKF